MSLFFKCDSCSKEAPGILVKNGSRRNPQGWYHRREGDVHMDVCSKECAQKMNQVTGKDSEIPEHPQ
jgi:hypothetical protein